MIHLLIASIIWAVVFGVTKYVLPEVDAQLIAFIRCAIAAILFIPFFFLKRKQKISKKAKKGAVLIGLLYGLMYTPYIMAYQYLNAYQVGLMTLTASLYVCVFFDWYEKKLNPKSYLYAILSILGSFIILYRDEGLNIVFKGAILVEMASLCFAFAQVSYKNLKQKHPTASDENLFAYINLSSALVAALMCYVFSDFSGIPNITSNEWMALIYLGIFATGIAFYLWNKGCTKVGITVIVVANNLKVPMIAILSYFVFHENEYPRQLLMGSIILGLALLGSEFHNLKKKYFKPAQ